MGGAVNWRLSGWVGQSWEVEWVGGAVNGRLSGWVGLSVGS